MNKKVFKETEIHVANINGRYYIDTEDFEKTLYDLIFAKHKLDQKTLRTVQLLSSSIRKTYKALLLTDKFDVNEETAVIELSRKKIKKLVKKAYKAAISETTPEDILELEDLSVDDTVLAISKEATEEFITATISNEIKPLEALIENIEYSIIEVKKDLKKAPSEAKVEQKKSKSKKETVEPVATDDIDVSDDEIDELMKK